MRMSLWRIEVSEEERRYYFNALRTVTEEIFRKGLCEKFPKTKQFQ